MTTTEAAALIGTIRLFILQDARIEVRVQDVKTSYGKTRLIVEPVAGTGNFTIELKNTETKGN